MTTSIATASVIHPSAHHVQWMDACAVDDLLPDTGATILLGGRQIALIRYGTGEQVYALSNWDPFSRAMVISRGIFGSLKINADDIPKIASPIYKQNFDLRTGRCLDDLTVALFSYPIRLTAGRVQVQLPD